MSIIKNDPNELKQLALHLDLPEPEEHEGLSPEEVQRVSMAAMSTLDRLIEARTAEISKLDADDPCRSGRDWFDDYLQLLDLQYDWRVAAYIAWESSPRNGRWPGSITELATEVLGLKSPRVIYTWRKKNPNIDNAISMMQSAPLYAHRRDVIDALVAVAKDPDYKAHKDRRLFFEMIGDYTPRQDVSVNDKRAIKDDDLSNLSDEELAKREAALLASDAPVPPGSDDEDGENT